MDAYGNYHTRTISIHALREEGDGIVAASFKSKCISIHALREEGDVRKGISSCMFPISIHALREEGDCLPPWPDRPPGISIHALREEGDAALQAKTTKINGFLSTPSARRATCPIRLPRSFGVYFYPRPPRGGRPGSLTR